VTSAALPAGVVTYTAGSTAPTGWLIANGSSVSRTTYAALFAAIGTTYGSLDANSFTLPDLRGYFVRGLDLGRGVDAGRALGTTQTGTVQAHQHVGSWGEAGSGTFGQTTSSSYPGSNATDNDNKLFFTNNGSDFDGLSNSGVIATETRPVNIAMTGIIKT
jgi:microcystin-dependent protein